MKYILFVIMTSLTLGAYAQNLKFEGKLAGLTANTKVILSDLMNKRFHDTATVSNNSFAFDCKLPGAGLYVLRVGLVGRKPENRTFYLDAGKVVLKGERGSLKKAELSSEDPYMKDWLQFDQIMQNEPVLALHKRQNDTVIMLAAKTGSYEGLFADTAFSNRSMAVFPLVEAKKIELAKAWLSEHPKSDINGYIIYIYLRRSLDENELKQALDALSPVARKSILGKIMLGETVNKRKVK